MRPCHVEQRPTEISRLPDLGKPCQAKGTLEALFESKAEVLRDFGNCGL